jgi:NADH-quinone oxidoreductase subunit M
LSLLLSSLIFLPLAGAPAVFLTTRFNKRAGIYLSAALAVVVFLVSAYVFWAVFSNPPAGGQFAFLENYSWLKTPVFGLDYMLGIDGLSSPLLLISSLLTVFVIIGSRRLIDHHEAEYYSLLFMFEGAIMGVFASLNLILFYVFWELVLIPMFFFIGVWGGPRRKYASVKFILFTYAGSTIMLLGFLYYYLGMSSPSFDIPTIQAALLAHQIPASLEYLPLLASFIGFGVKLPVFPFHTWLPDAHVEAPAPISVLLAGVLLKMGGYGFLRISLGLFPNASATYAWVFIAIALFSMFYGAIVALLQKDLKKMIAFTSINHMGFVLLGGYATVVTGSVLGVEGAILQMFAHALAVGSLFMLSGYIHHQAGTREIPLLKGLRSTMPRTAAILVVASGAAIGMPPFASFLAEFMVIAASITAYQVTAISVLVPVITAAYFLWTIKRTVLSAPEGTGGATDMTRADFASFMAYFVPLVLLLVFSFLILTPAAHVAQFLGGGG